MLVKKELLTIPVLPYRVIKPKSEYSRNLHSEFAQEIDMPLSGHVVVVDLYAVESQELYMRIFFDGKNVVSFHLKKDEWSESKPGTELGVWYSREINSAPSAQEILKKLRKRDWGSDNLIEFFEDVVSKKYQKARDRAWKREQKLYEELTAMLPEYPKNLPAYCEKQVYGSTYIFIGKIKGGQRTAVCAHCGHQFAVEKSVKPHQRGKCPHCGESAEYFADWVNPPDEKKRRICICHRAAGNLIIRWTKIKRQFAGQKTQYYFDDYYWNFYICDGQKETLYAYHWVDNMGCSKWVRLKNGTDNTEATYIYLSNLRQVFGRNMYGVDLAAELQGCKDKISITSLLNSLKNIPQAKYFLQKGMRRLAQDMFKLPQIGDGGFHGKSFQEVLGIRAQYLPMYQKYDVTMWEHTTIKACDNAWIDEDLFLKIREMDMRKIDIVRYSGFLKTVTTIKKSINYLYKQYQKNNGSQCLGQLIDFWHDYLTMSTMLKVDITNKQIKFPKDLVNAHNILSVRAAAIRDKVRAEKVKEAFKTIYNGIPQYATKKYRIVFPESEADFLREGQQLDHCVGNGTYFNRHIEGVNMIFFIRKAEDPEKPFFTAEVNVQRRTIVQLYGNHDCRAPKEIENFVKQFCKCITPCGQSAQEEKGLIA